MLGKTGILWHVADMESNEISYHEVEVMRVLKGAPDKWWSNGEIAAAVRKVSPRTVRAKTAKFVSLGMCDVAEVFPHHMYRWSEKAKQRNSAYLARLDKAAEVLSGYMASLD